MLFTFDYFNFIYNYIWFAVGIYISFTSFAICQTFRAFKITFLKNKTKSATKISHQILN